MSNNSTTTAIRILSIDGNTYVVFYNETDYAGFLAGDKSKKAKMFKIDNLDFAENEIMIICENGVPTKIDVIG